MLEAITAAQKSIRLETYIYSDGKLGRQFLGALLAAAQRGVRVQILVDALGSWLLSDDFFEPLVTAGAEVRRFNAATASGRPTVWPSKAAGKCENTKWLTRAPSGMPAVIARTAS